MVSFSKVIFKFPGYIKLPGHRAILEKDFDLLSSTWLLPLVCKFVLLRAHLGVLQNDMSEEHGEHF